MYMMKTTTLFPGLIAGQNVVDSNGRLLVRSGSRINSKTIQVLREQGIQELSVAPSIMDETPIATFTFSR